MAVITRIKTHLYHIIPCSRCYASYVIIRVTVHGNRVRSRPHQYLIIAAVNHNNIVAFACINLITVTRNTNARLPFSVKYFLIAILFVLFDVEVIFFYPWAVNFRELGQLGFLKMLVFIAPLLLGYFYIIKKGALKWD